LVRIILILHCIKTLENLDQHCDIDFVMSDVIKMQFTDKDGHLA